MVWFILFFAADYVTTQNAKFQFDNTLWLVRVIFFILHCFQNILILDANFKFGIWFQDNKIMSNRNDSLMSNINFCRIYYCLNLK